MTAGSHRVTAGRAMAMRGALGAIGFAAYVAWNVLMTAISILTFLVTTPARASR